MRLRCAAQASELQGVWFSHGLWAASRNKEPGMSYLCEQQLNTLHQLLDKREQVDRPRMDDETGLRFPPFDLADETDLKQLSGHHSEWIFHEPGRLRGIEAAATPFVQGVAGTCRACGGEIPLARLKALPGTTRCLPCQRRHEQAPARVAEALRDE